ncbi:MAG: hypothetical protein QOG56_2612 [Solirubrobacteraceae bacterium]|nr:hypothetical protein [Solirubrobacteraceae bacterium]
MGMFIGLHALIPSTDADAVRAFLRDMLELPSVDAGGGWLIFGVGPAEVAVHPTADAMHAQGGAHLYLMCEDVKAAVAALEGKGVEISQPVTDQGYGVEFAIRLPDGQQLHIYEPRHPTALEL